MNHSHLIAAATVFFATPIVLACATGALWAHGHTVEGTLVGCYTSFMVAVLCVLWEDAT